MAPPPRQSPFPIDRRTAVRKSSQSCDRPRCTTHDRPVSMRPDDRMIGRHRAAGVRALVERGQDGGAEARIRLKVVPLVAARPAPRYARHRWMSGVLDLYGRVLNVGVTGEIRAHQSTVERPVVLGVGCRMHADKSPAAANEPLERRLLRAVQDIARRRQEHHRLISRERRIVEHVAIFGRVHGKAAHATLLLNGGNACGN